MGGEGKKTGCMVCTGMAAYGCDDCPLKLCTDCEVKMTMMCECPFLFPFSLENRMIC